MTEQLVSRLRDVLDRSGRRYKELGASNLGAYLTGAAKREDEELLTEPLLADLLEDLLGFPHDAYFPQLGRSGLKPDFTPHDLVAHRLSWTRRARCRTLPPTSRRSGPTSTSVSSTTGCRSCLTRLHEALKAGDAARAQALGGEFATHGSDAELAGAVELFVRAIAQNRRQLLPLRDLFPSSPGPLRTLGARGCPPWARPRRSARCLALRKLRCGSILS